MSRDRDIDGLYALPLAEFTAARNELAKRLRSRGDRGAADEVKTLAKPTVAAWAVNQLFYSRREAFDRLLAAGAAQHRAMTGTGATSRAAAERKRDALGELLRHAEELLVGAGSKWTPGLRQRVHRTLETLATRPAGPQPFAGRLTEDLQPTGFDALLGASIAPAAAKRSRKAPKAKRPSAAAVRRREAALARVRASKTDLAAARRKKTAAARELTRLERQTAEAGKRSRAAELRAEKARRKAEELELRLRKARSALEQAARAVARTEAKLETEVRRSKSMV